MGFKRNTEAKDTQKGALRASKKKKEAPDGIIKRFVESNYNKSINALAAASNLPESTLRTANLNPVTSLKIPTLVSIAKAMDMRPGTVLDELFEIERSMQLEKLEAVLATFAVAPEMITDQLAENGAVMISMPGPNKESLLASINEKTNFEAYAPERTREAIIIQNKDVEEEMEGLEPIRLKPTLGAKQLSSASLNAMYLGRTTVFAEPDSQRDTHTMAIEALRNDLKKSGKRD